MHTTTLCPNCDCGAICTADVFCDGCDQVLCTQCWREHNDDQVDHTEHVAVMRDRGMSDAEILADFKWHIDTGESMPDYSVID